MYRLTLFCLILVMATASCSTGPADNSFSSSAGSSKNKSGDSDMPVPPADAQYTIRCQTYAGPDHAQESRLVVQQLRANTPLKDWYVVHKSDSSTLFYGFYRTFDPRDSKDAKEGQRAIKDLNAVRSMADSTGVHPFSASLPELLDSPDPAADPKWDLARSGGYYSLEIAVFKDIPDRKEAAVDAVRAARAQGVEAYYYHGPVSSSVCIGAWPQSSAQEIDPSQENTDPNMPLVLTVNPLGDDAVKQLAQKGYKAIAPSINPVDPTMIGAMRQFPTHAVNGVIGKKITDPATGQTRIVQNPSFLVKIPKPEENPDQSNTPTVDTGAPHIDNRPAVQPGVGQLKSLGE
jgi:hypothetical protein